MTKRALFTGTFDPFTNGHLDIVKRASVLFDEVVVAVSFNELKNTLFTVEERANLIAEVVKDINNIAVVIHKGGLTVNLAYELNCQVVVKGIRNGQDFDYEQLKIIYGELANANIETIIFPTRQELSHISSSGVKEFFKTSGDVSKMVPDVVYDALKQKLEVKTVEWQNVIH